MINRLNPGSYKRYWQLEPNVIAEVIRDHKRGEESIKSHPWWHAGMVADFAGRLIWKKTGNEKRSLMAEAAGWFHSVDYYGDWNECLARYRKLSKIFTDVEWQEVVDAVKNHSKRPDGSEALLVKCLQASDQFATMGFLGALQIAVHRPNLPVANPRYITKPDPETTYKNPKSNFDHAIFHRLEWYEWAKSSDDKDVVSMFEPGYEWLKCSMELTLYQLDGVCEMFNDPEFYWIYD